MRTDSLRQLFSIDRPAAGPDAGADAVDSWIYAGFNRVVHERRGLPSSGRVGTGVERVEIFLTP